MNLSSNDRAVYNQMRSLIARQRQVGRSKSNNGIVKTEFADQVNYAVTEDFTTKLPSVYVSFEEGTKVPKEVDVTIHSGSQVDNVPETRDYVSFSINDQHYSVRQEMENGRLDHSLSRNIRFKKDKTERLEIGPNSWLIDGY